MTTERKRVDLSRFNNADFPKGAGGVKMTLWYFTNALFFLNPLFPFRSVKPGLLRLFGAKVGQGVVIHPCVNIKYPWKLTIGDHVWIGQRAWLDNIDRLTIGNHVVISQGAMIIQGSHNYKRIDYPTMSGPVVLEEGSWVGAGAMVMLGVTLRSHSVLSAGGVANMEFPPMQDRSCSLAQNVRERVIE